MTTRGYLGIDAGTQGLSVVLTDEDLHVLSTGDGHYDMCEGLGEGCYEQRPDDWVEALKTAMHQLREHLDGPVEVLGIGISGQMHGEVLVDAQGQSVKPARLWCDARNEAEGQELTEVLNVKIPKRMTSARWLWTLRNEPEMARQTERLTTPGGWIAFRLTGEFNLGVGDAAGMFPIDHATGNYDAERLARFDQLAREAGDDRSFGDRLPAVRRAGEPAGALTDEAASWLGLEPGIPVAAAEGDQPASLAGSLIGRAGTVSVSFGTSVCANSVGDHAFDGVSRAVDHFCAPDGKPINMVWLRNGTTFMNTIVEMFGQPLGGDSGAAFEALMPDVVTAAVDCDGLLALPFMDDEPGLGVAAGGRALLHGINPDNSRPANAIRAALMATMFNLRKGCEVLDAQGFPRTEIILSGGLARTPQLGQVLADVLQTPVKLMPGADEGCAWGAAALAKYRVNPGGLSWEAFLDAQPTGEVLTFEPDAEAVQACNRMYRRYLDLLDTVIE